MSKHNAGEVSAYFPSQGTNKSYYRKIGNLFKEQMPDGSERLSIKLDFIPIGNRWEGWCNVFPLAETVQPAPKPGVPLPTRPRPHPAHDDDIPF